MAGTIADKLQGLIDSKADIAAAIEERGGTVPDRLAEYGDAIRNLPEDVEPADVEFIDYDGTVLYKYTFEEAAELAAMPTPPTRTGFTTEGWNYTLSDIQTIITNAVSNAGMSHVYKYLDLPETATIGEAQQLLGLPDTAGLSDMLAAIPARVYTPKITVGCTYITDDASTYITFETTKANQTFEIAFSQNQASAVGLDWGNGTINNPVGTQNLVTRPMAYSTAGEHTIKIWDVKSGTNLKLSGYICGNCGQKFDKGYTNNNIPTALQGVNTVSADMLKTVRLGKVKELGGGTFSGCKNIAAISIPSTATAIGTAFDGCENIKAIVIPRGVTSLSSYAFRNCASLTKVSLPVTVTSVGDSAFEGCASLKYMCLTPYIASMGKNAFSSCGKLKHVYGNVSSACTLGVSIFSGCESLEYADFEDGITFSGSMFNGCRSLKDVKQTEVPWLGGSGTNIFNGCIKLGEIGVITATSIPENAFYSCRSLRTMIFKDNGTRITIGKNAFAYSSVTTFDFSQCTASSPPALDSTAFDKTPGDKVIIVPSGQLSTWQGASNWLSHASLMREP